MPNNHKLSRLQNNTELGHIQDTSQLIREHGFLVIMEVSDYFDAVCLHINDRYATCFLSKRTYPLLGATLQPTFKNVCVTFKQYLMSLFSRHALHKVITCNVFIQLIIAQQVISLYLHQYCFMKNQNN